MNMSIYELDDKIVVQNVGSYSQYTTLSNSIFGIVHHI